MGPNRGGILASPDRGWVSERRVWLGRSQHDAVFLGGASRIAGRLPFPARLLMAPRASARSGAKSAGGWRSDTHLAETVGRGARDKRYQPRLQPAPRPDLPQVRRGKMTGVWIIF